MATIMEVAGTTVIVLGEITTTEKALRRHLRRNASDKEG